jgi:hypothetical protein
MFFKIYKLTRTEDDFTSSLGTRTF